MAQKPVLRGEVGCACVAPAGARSRNSLSLHCQIPTLGVLAAAPRPIKPAISILASPSRLPSPPSAAGSDFATFDPLDAHAALVGFEIGAAAYSDYADW